jgi:hypothetical protein
MYKFLIGSKVNASEIKSQDYSNSVDEELLKNLDLLMELDVLEEADEWVEILEMPESNKATKVNRK